MRTFVSRHALAMSLAAASVAGCGGSQPPIAAPGAIPRASALTARTNNTDNYKVVHSFGAGSDGSSPQAGLVDVGGTLYGTTYDGGSYAKCYTFYSGCGTVFSITQTGTERVVHSFSGYPADGAFSQAGLIDVKGTLYGTTSAGGSNYCYFYSTVYYCGTVFSITPRGKEKVLYSFGEGTGSANPAATLIDVKGTLYGTTRFGGAVNSSKCNGGCGTVFSITPSGAEKVLHSFSGYPADGADPVASLIEVNGKLYGTTVLGGSSSNYCAGSATGCGTVFSITPSGKEKVLHSFGGGADGASPQAGLINVRGTLYGTTRYGGTDNKCTVGCGTVFSITQTGTERVLHAFHGYPDDGADPIAPMIEVKGALYGTTYGGGTNNNRNYCGSNNGCGTVFTITPNGTEEVLHSFGKATDGLHPEAGLIDVGGTLYGTTTSGGKYEQGYAHGGTIFALSP
jgi:uncharacterized repeat protein (TIGR03803 family)